jgi:hypothetical protein
MGYLMTDENQTPWPLFDEQGNLNASVPIDNTPPPSTDMNQDNDYAQGMFNQSNPAKKNTISGMDALMMAMKGAEIARKPHTPFPYASAVGGKAAITTPNMQSMIGSNPRFKSMIAQYLMRR